MNLSFEDVERDIERWLEKYAQQEFLSGGQICFRGYDGAKASVVDLYFKRGKYRQLVSFALKGYKELSFINRLTDALFEERNFLQLRRLWTFLSGEKKSIYWQVLTVREFFPCVDHLGNSFSASEAREEHVNQTIPACREETLSLLRRYESILSAIDENDVALLLLREEMKLIASGQQRKAMGKALKDKIDESRFWQLINEANKSELDMASATNHLITSLERYSGAQIKNFQKLLLRKLDLLNRWDVWALAYLAQDGCSDDAFEAFRCWVVMQGQDLFSQVIQDVNTVLPSVPKGSSTACEGLIQSACLAYESREGRPLLVSNGTAGKVQGVAWKEETVAEEFPEIAGWYARN